MSINGVLTDLEGHIGLWCGSFPAVSSIIKLITDKLRAGSRENNTTQSKHSVYTVSRLTRKKHEREYEMNNLFVEGEDCDSQRAMVAATDEDAGDSTDDERRGIQKETEFIVSEEYVSKNDRDAEIPAHIRLSRSWETASFRE